MGGFFSDLLTSTFDPRYGMLGRPVSGALRSALDIGSQMDPFKYKLKEFPNPKLTMILDSFLNKLFTFTLHEYYEYWNKPNEEGKI